MGMDIIMIVPFHFHLNDYFSIIRRNFPYNNPCPPVRWVYIQYELEKRGLHFLDVIMLLTNQSMGTVMACQRIFCNGGGENLCLLRSILPLEQNWSQKKRRLLRISHNSGSIKFIYVLDQTYIHTYDPFMTFFILPSFSASRIITPILDVDNPNFSLSDAIEISCGFCSTTSTTIL